MESRFAARDAAIAAGPASAMLTCAAHVPAGDAATAPGPAPPMLTCIPPVPPVAMQAAAAGACHHGPTVLEHVVHSWHELGDESDWWSFEFHLESTLLSDKVNYGRDLATAMRTTWRRNQLRISYCGKSRAHRGFVLECVHCNRGVSVLYDKYHQKTVDRDMGRLYAFLGLPLPTEAPHV